MTLRVHRYGIECVGGGSFFFFTILVCFFLHSKLSTRDIYSLDRLFTLHRPSSPFVSLQLFLAFFYFLFLLIRNVLLSAFISFVLFFIRTLSSNFLYRIYLFLKLFLPSIAFYFTAASRIPFFFIFSLHFLIRNFRVYLLLSSSSFPLLEMRSRVGLPIYFLPGTTLVFRFAPRSRTDIVLSSRRRHPVRTAPR